MTKRFFLLLTLLLSVLPFAPTRAQGFPTVSTEANTVYYLIRFLNCGNAITATTNGAQISTAAATGADSQLWKIEGNATQGYTLTNKAGLTLCATSSAKNTMVKASSSPSGTTRFNIVQTTISSYSGGFEIQPMGNAAVSMNLWGGPNENRGVGFWDKADVNNPVRFQSEASYKSAGNISLIPYPAQLTVVKEGTKDFTTLKTITYTNETVRKHAEDFAQQWQKASGHTMAVQASPANRTEGSIHLSQDASLGAEAYTLTVDDKGIYITAAQEAGFFYALQTLKQLLPREYFSTNAIDVAWTVPFVNIADHPALGHRGYMLDIARHYFDKEQVKRILDIMAFYKMNRFHWHLTDDQGWRIEIPEYPKLTEVGAVRSGSFSNPGEGGAFYDDTEYGRGMWYSQADLKEIVAYATERHIEIIPEVDLPGHMVAAVTSYPEFSCDPTKSYSVRIDGGISEDVLNVGKDEVIDFLKCVLGHVATIFPYKYIHIGGDECPTGQWANNADCLRRVREEGLAGVHELQSWLVEELGIYLKQEYGKDIVVWDELLSHWKSSNTVKPVIMAWNNINKSAEAANAGMKSIVVPYQQLYLDFMQVPPAQCNVDEPYYGGWGDAHYNTLEEVYNLNPVSALGGREEYCLGVQGNMWTETCNDGQELEYQLLPRLLALSETGWLPAAQKDWDDFLKRLQTHDEILEQLGYNYAKHYITAEEQSNVEAAIDEATEILAQSVRGGVGYPSAEVYDALREALTQAQNDDTKAGALTTALNTFKSAPIVQPVSGKVYQIVSASTYYKKQFDGSTVYADGNSVRFHYTPQVEPEELWVFENANGGYTLRNLCTGTALQMPSINSAVTLTESNATAIRVDKATTATGTHTYIPGVVTLSAVTGYYSHVTGNVKRMFGDISGQVYAKDDNALCHPGTWRIVEVTDFTEWLKGLCDKCEHILLTAQPGEMGQPTQGALDFLTKSILTPAQAAVEQGGVSEETYNKYVALYNQFLGMERTGIADSFEEGYYYRIRNAWFTNYFATANLSNNQVVPQTQKEGDEQLWRIEKNADATVVLVNKATQTAAYISSNATDQTVRLGKPYNWVLEERTLDSKKGICIIEGSGANSWYTNPDAWNYVLMKPFWGACIWTFEKSDVIITGIEKTNTNATDNDAKWYDTSGRHITHPTNGVFINDRGEKRVK